MLWWPKGPTVPWACMKLTVGNWAKGVTGPLWLKALIEHTRIKSVGDTNLEGAVNSLEVREALQKDNDRLELWAITMHMKFKNKY